MSCLRYEEQIALAAYGELSDAERHALEQHLNGCDTCREHQRQVAAMVTLLSANPVVEPTANQLAGARIRLADALDNLPEPGWFARLLQSLRFARIAATPLTAAAALILTLGAGGGTGYWLAAHRYGTQLAAVQSAQNSPEEAQVYNVSSIDRNPASNQVEVHYNRVVPATLTGSVEDPSVQQMLMLASQHSPNAGIRHDSVGLLAAECKRGRACTADQVRHALMMALRYDRNSAVRLAALDGLEPYIAEDPRVRDVVLDSVMNDNDPQIRAQSIQRLMPVEADSSVRQVLTHAALRDDSEQIRTQSRQLLNQLGEIQ